MQSIRQDTTNLSNCPAMREAVVMLWGQAGERYMEEQPLRKVSEYFTGKLSFQVMFYCFITE